MGFPEIASNHYDGHQNITTGQKHDGDEALATTIGRFKSGSHTFGGAGSYDVAFATAFPAATYGVVFGATAAAGLPIWENKVAGGFRITVAAACDVAWLAVYQG